MTGGSGTWTFTYDANGLRKTRTGNTGTYTYYYEGTRLIHMMLGYIPMSFTYDIEGAPAAVNYDGTVYYYVTNLQGDVLAICLADGTIVVEYTYDAWGNILSITGSMASTLGTLNPLRYRGYVYDQETGLYYLQSRYYNPTTGRFLNADVFISTGQGLLGNNMFAYCGNNPVVYYDPSGHAMVTRKDLGGGKPTCDDREDSITWSRDPYDAITNVHQQQVQTQAKITMQQNRLIGDALDTLWDARQHSIEFEAHIQYEQHMAVRNFFQREIERWEEDPLLIGDFAVNVLSAGSGYISFAAFCAGVSIPGAGQAAMLVIGGVGLIWSSLRYYEII